MGIGQEKQGLLSLLDRMEAENSSKGQMEFGMNRYLDMKAREKGVPLRGTFELTPLCNLDCKMCYVHLTEGQLCTNENRMLATKQWIGIIDQAIDAGMMFALLTGGEALMYHGFDEIYLYLQERGISIAINTNGILLTEDRILFFKKHPPREIRITLYGADEITYEKVTGHRVFSIVLENIIRAKHAGMPLSISITPNKYMEDGGEALISLAESLGIKYGINSSLSQPREETGRIGDHDIPLDIYVKLYKQQQRIRGKKFESVCADDLPLPGSKSNKELRGFRCGGGRSSFSVTWQGKMQPCLMGTSIQADLNDTYFINGWGKINDEVRKYPMPIECDGCEYKKLCTMCVFIHASGAPKGHANRALCTRAQRLIQEGIATLD